MLFACYGYFHQGGNWHQNSRFDQVRSIVENQQLEINEFLRYQVVADSAGRTRILRVRDPLNIDRRSPPLFANTGDVSIYAGRVYPNKPPGTVFLAVPIYWSIARIESLIGLDINEWWVLTVNAHLTTILSVGLLSAIGGVLFYFVSRRTFPDFPEWVHVATTLAYGLCTLIFPFATMLFDHNLVATISLAAFGILLVTRHKGFSFVSANVSYFFVGLLCGFSVLLNYLAVITVGWLMAYGLWGSKERVHFLFYSFAGMAAPAIFLLWYHLVCFGSLTATANTYQLDMFRSDGALLFGMLGLPKPRVLYELLFPPYRGIFFSSPVLLLAPLGVLLTGKDEHRRPEAVICTAIFASYWVVNSAFNEWHAGWTFGPRYLIPALPFLCLPLAPAFIRLPRMACGFGTVSMAIMLVGTAVDPLVPSTVSYPLGYHARILSETEKLERNGVQFDGPLSASPIGMHESWDFPAASLTLDQRKWQSFNLGEFVWQGSFWSLAPLVMILSLGLIGIWRILGKMEKIARLVPSEVSPAQRVVERHMTNHNSSYLKGEQRTKPS
jgi:hypothetical protein